MIYVGTAVVRPDVPVKNSLQVIFLYVLIHKHHVTSHTWVLMKSAQSFPLPNLLSEGGKQMHFMKLR